MPVTELHKERKIKQTPQNRGRHVLLHFTSDINRNNKVSLVFAGGILFA